MNLGGNILVQDVALRFGEVGIRQKHVDSKGNFVLDALAMGLGAGPKFKVFNTVVRALSVAMVGRLSGNKLSAQMLFHYVPMLKRMCGWLTTFAGDNNSDVPTRNAFGYFLVWVMSLVGQSSEQRAARGAAQIRSFGNIAARFSRCAHRFATLSAGYGVFSVSFCASANGEAFPRTISRVFAKSVFVDGEVSRLHKKFFAANFAEKFDRLFSRSYAAMLSLMSNATRFSAIARDVVIDRIHPEDSRAVFATFFHDGDNSKFWATSSPYYIRRGT